MRSISEWNIIEQIGTGSTSSVYLAQNSLTKVIGALKTFEATAALTASEEMKIHKSLKHPRILTYLDSFSCINKVAPSDSSAVLVTELASKGDLFNLIDTVGCLPEKVARTYFNQLLDALSYLHFQSICHLDIKPENVLLDRNFGVKLADFGISKKLASPDQLLRDRIGTVFYTPPEKLRPESVYDGFKADLFALGVTLFTMVNGGLPFESASMKDEFYKLIIEGDYAGFWESHKEVAECPEQYVFSQDFIELMNKMLAFDPEERLSLKELKAHKWTSGAVFNEKQLKSEVTQLFLDSLEDC